MGDVTVKWLQDYLLAARDIADPGVQNDLVQPIAQRIVCADGFSMSVQAGWTAFCSPQTNIAQWYEVEVGRPSSAPSAFLDYQDESLDPTAACYAFVPIELVVQEINSHGGVA